MKPFAISFQQGFPLWFRKIHICQAGRFFNMFFAVLKPFLSKEVKVKVTLGFFRPFSVNPSNVNGSKIAQILASFMRDPISVVHINSYCI